jgi:hypothetical protein
MTTYPKIAIRRPPLQWHPVVLRAAAHGDPVYAVAYPIMPLSCGLYQMYFYVSGPPAVKRVNLSPRDEFGMRTAFVTMYTPQEVLAFASNLVNKERRTRVTAHELGVHYQDAF